MVTPLNIDEIVSDPGTRDGQPIIDGTTIRVVDVVLAHTTGNKLSAEEIALNYRLSMGQVYAALAYYYLHQTAIEADVEKNESDAAKYLEILDHQGKLKRIE